MLTTHSYRIRMGIIWCLWAIVNLVLSYRYRFWITSDAIGSFDAARSMRMLDFPNALNASWGQGFAFFLMFTPLYNIDSWLSARIILVVLLLVSQYWLYLALRYAGIPMILATALAFAWALACYATGSMTFMTADVVLCLFASLYLLLAIKYVHMQPARVSVLAALGILHALAGITKTIAFPGLLIFPLALLLGNVILAARRKLPLQLAVKRIAITSLSYAMPLVLLAAAWGFACQAKYGHFTLGEASSYNIDLFIHNSQQLRDAGEQARRELPRWGSYWWSDFGLNVRWEHSRSIDLRVQLTLMLGNAVIFLRGSRDFLTGFVLFVIMCVAFLAFFRYRKLSSAIPSQIWALALVAGWVMALYLSVNFQARYFSFPALFALPLCGVILTQLLQGARRWVRLGVIAGVAGGLFHGVAAIAVAALVLVPGGQHFEIAQLIRERARGPVGVVLEGEQSIRHYGIVAYLANTQAAELTQLGDTAAHFSSGFVPGSVMMAVDPEHTVPSQVWVDARSYSLLKSWNYQGGSRQGLAKLALYLPDDITH